MKHLPEKSPAKAKRTCYIKWFCEIGIEDVPIVGGKTASLGEMFRELTPKGVKVPDGFAITAQAYRDFLSEAELDGKIDDLLGALDTRNLDALHDCGSKIREAIVSAPLPGNLEGEILAAYDELQEIGACKRRSRSQKQRHGRGFAGRQFCRATRDLSERAGPSRAA